jgi:hypothetical protein
MAPSVPTAPLGIMVPIAQSSPFNSTQRTPGRLLALYGMCSLTWAGGRRKLSRPADFTSPEPEGSFSSGSQPSRFDSGRQVWAGRTEQESRKHQFLLCTTWPWALGRITCPAQEEKDSANWPDSTALSQKPAWEVRVLGLWFWNPIIRATLEVPSNVPSVTMILLAYNFPQLPQSPEWGVWLMERHQAACLLSGMLRIWRSVWISTPIQ